MDLQIADIDHLPQVKRRIRALQKLQNQKSEDERQMIEEYHLIQAKYHNKWLPIYAKRADIISGKVEPTDEECDFALDFQSEEDTSNVSVEVPNDESNNASVVGIPGFWLRVLQNFALIRQWITEEDELALLHLKNISVNIAEDLSKTILEFQFESNEFFTNEVLTKEYDMQNESVPSKGCPIDWKKGKNLCEIPSFFYLFAPPDQSNDDFDSVDQNIGKLIIVYVVPEAVLFYTGEKAEDDNDYEEDDEYEEDEDMDEDDEDDGHYFGGTNSGINYSDD